MFSHFATKQFWEMYHALPPEIRELADKNYLLLNSDPFHPRCTSKKLARSGQCESEGIIGRWLVRSRKVFSGFGLVRTRNMTN